MQVTYEIGKLTKPKQDANPFLFVFTNKTDALHFMRNGSGDSVYEGVAINPNRKRYTKRGDVVIATTYPDGTVFADAFLPLKKVC